MPTNPFPSSSGILAPQRGSFDTRALISRMLLGQNDQPISHPVQGFANIAKNVLAVALLKSEERDREEKQKLFTSELANALQAEGFDG